MNVTRASPESAASLDIACDVLVVGAGPLGLLTAHFLAGQGARLAVIDDRGASTRADLGAFWPSPSDPPTRAEVAHGTELARWLVDYHAQGVELARSRALADLLPAREASVFRYGLEAFERTELERAAASEGFGLVPAPFGHGGVSLAESSSARVLDDTDAARHRLLEGVVALGARVFRERAIALEESTRGVVVTTARGRRVNAEIVVLAMAARTSELLPGYEKVLVPMTDAAFFWKRTGTRTGTRAGTGTGTSTGTSTRAPRAATDTTPLAGREGIALRGHSGHVAVVWNPIDSRTPLRISGPRFLWPGAGVGVAHEGNVDSRMRARALDFHRAKTLPLLARALGCPTWEAFAEREGLVFEGGRFGVDCLPCDELPVVGEFGRWGRILGASGFLGTGWSAHVSSARALADFVDRGASKDLHPRLSPRRFDAGT